MRDLLPGQTHIFPLKPCVVCGENFEPLSGTALYCTEACKKRAQRKRRTERDREYLAEREALKEKGGILPSTTPTHKA